MNKMNKIFLFLILIYITQNIFADYPVVSYRYLADPGALVYNGRVYIYCSNDDNNTGTEDAGYEMYSIVCISSSDLKNWTDHGVVFQVPRDASWAGKSWAPSPAEKNGKFYLYFGDGGSSIGVAVADTPIGTFKDPINGRLITSNTPGVQPADNMWLFDPMTFIDDDGQAYCYFGGNGEDNMRVIKLNEDMISVDGSATSFHVPFFFEASWMHKHNGIYYFSYSTNPNNGMRIDYMMSDNPTSGFTYGGVLSNQPPSNNNNNHQAIFELNGNWYQVYHNRYVANQNGILATYKRNICIDMFTYNDDGTIKTMVNTVDGVKQIGNINPYNIVEAETINKQKGIEINICNTGGMKVSDIENGDWIKVRGVDFGNEGVAAFTSKVSSEMKIGTNKVGEILILLDGLSGNEIGVMPVSYTGGVESWNSKTIAINKVTGIHDVYFVFIGEEADDIFNLDSWSFIQNNGQHDLLAINLYSNDYKIDTISTSNSTSFIVKAVYSDGTSEDITSLCTFTIDDENVISISDTNITAINYGKAKIIANYNDFSDSLNIVVKNRESELTVSRLYSDETNFVLFSSATREIKIFAEFNDGHSEDVTKIAEYDNPNPEIVTISNGVIKAVAEGEVEITVNYKGDFGETQTLILNIKVIEGLSLWFEPECAEIGENWDILSSSQASNGKYVTAKSGFESNDEAPTGNENRIIIPFNLDIAGSFSLYARLNCADYNDDSFWISIDGGAFSMYNGLVTNGWEWLLITDIELTQGDHYITIGYREDGAALDKIAVSNYPISSTGMGEEAINLCDPTSVEYITEIPEHYALEQNYPNPFNPETIISYHLPQTGFVTLKVYDTLGREVAELINKKQSAGKYKVSFNAANLSSGVYIYKIFVKSLDRNIRDYKQANKMLLVK